MDSLLIITSLLQKVGGYSPSPRKGRQDRTGGNKQHNPTLASSRNTPYPEHLHGFKILGFF